MIALFNLANFLLKPVNPNFSPMPFKVLEIKIWLKRLFFLIKMMEADDFVIKPFSFLSF